MKTAKVRYTGSLKDGSIFDQTPEGETFSFTLDQKEVIPGFENAVASMSVGEKKRIEIPAAEAYGDHLAELVSEIERSYLSKDLDLTPGGWLEVREGSEVMRLKIVDLTETTVTLDANHPLAGQDLIFEVELVELA